MGDQPHLFPMHRVWCTGNGQIGCEGWNCTTDGQFMRLLNYYCSTSQKKSFARVETSDAERGAAAVKLWHRAKESVSDWHIEIRRVVPLTGAFSDK